jgi:hypothetical protein
MHHKSRDLFFHYLLFDKLLMMMEWLVTMRLPIICYHYILINNTLGPLLFLIFINDLSFFLNCAHTLFADDTTIYTNAETFLKALGDLKSMVKVLLDWCNHKKMEINWLKTKAMIITSIRKNRSDLPVELDLHNSVEVVNEFKLLGVILNSKLNFSNQVLNLKKAITKKLFIIKNMFHLSSAVRLQFFKSFILPYFDY